MRNKIDIHREVTRVIGGTGGLPPMPFPHDPRASDMVVDWTWQFSTNLPEATTAQRALFIRKLATYVIRRGRPHEHVLDLLHGMLWFTRHPQHLNTRLSFGGAVGRQREYLAAATKRVTRPLAADIDSPLSPRPLILEHGDFTLEQLVHARHVLEVGLYFNNCLKIQIGARFLPNRRYWNDVKDGRRHLYTIRDHARLCVILGFEGHYLTEIQSCAPPPNLWLAMPFFADAIARLHGPVTPIRNFALWPNKPAMAPLEYQNPGHGTFFRKDPQ